MSTQLRPPHGCVRLRKRLIIRQTRQSCALHSVVRASCNVQVALVIDSGRYGGAMGEPQRPGPYSVGLVSAKSGKGKTKEPTVFRKQGRFRGRLARAAQVPALLARPRHLQIPATRTPTQHPLQKNVLLSLSPSLLLSSFNGVSCTACLQSSVSAQYCRSRCSRHQEDVQLPRNAQDNNCHYLACHDVLRCSKMQHLPHKEEKRRRHFGASLETWPPRRATASAALIRACASAGFG